MKRAKKTTRGVRHPRFVDFKLYRAAQGAVLYALDAVGRLWEKYPNRPWGCLDEFSVVPLEPRIPVPALPPSPRSNPPEPERQWTPEEILAHFTPKPFVPEAADVDPRCPNCRLLLSADGICIGCPRLRAALALGAQGRREV